MGGGLCTRPLYGKNKYGDIMREKNLKIIVAILLLVVAIARMIFFNYLSSRIDNVFLIIIFAAILILILPLEKISKLKIGDIEVNLEQPPIKAAINSLGLDRIQNKKLYDRLLSYKNDLKSIVGSKVLWIDDKPQSVYNERRLLRSLGILIISVNSSEKAEELFTSDYDYDLIISDVQRTGVSYKFNNGIDIHEGVNFIYKIKSSSNEVIKNIPVIYFAAYDLPRLKEFTRPVTDNFQNIEISNSVIDFITKVLDALLKVRSQIISYSEIKTPTYPN